MRTEIFTTKENVALTMVNGEFKHKHSSDFLGREAFTGDFSAYIPLGAQALSP